MADVFVPCLTDHRGGNESPRATPNVHCPKQHLPLPFSCPAPSPDLYHPLTAATPLIYTPLNVNMYLDIIGYCSPDGRETRGLGVSRFY